jgi:isoaspartyl peptidase/L-asparaginase-like protein (Ntn-hydrolase superfamily)
VSNEDYTVSEKTRGSRAVLRRRDTMLNVGRRQRHETTRKSGITRKGKKKKTSKKKYKAICKKNQPKNPKKKKKQKKTKNKKFNHKNKKVSIKVGACCHI